MRNPVGTFSRRELFAISGVGLAVAPFVHTARRNRRPNLLFLMADDHAGYLLGADGNGKARTPNLDRLAAGGTRFARNFCNSPVCTPSRQSILTGLLPHAAGVTTNQTPLSTEKPTIARQLRVAGYYTGVIGKMHWNRWKLQSKQQPQARSRVKPEPGIHGFDWPMADNVAYDWHRDSIKDQVIEYTFWGGRLPVPEGIQTKPPWRVFLDPTRVWLNADKLPDPGYEKDLRGTFIANKGIEFLKEHKNHPFALWVSFNEPHAPFAFPIEDRDEFAPIDFEVPLLGRDDWPLVPLIFRDLNEADKRGIAAAYYSSVQYLDRNIGRVLKTLEELDLAEDTLVVYTSDHGYLLGHHGRFEKGCMFDEPMRTPLLMRFPRGFKGGRVVQALTESVDIAGTILELLGAERLPVDHGRSLVPLLEGRTRLHRDVIFSEFLENEEAGVRTREWKLMYGSGKRHRLDGYETENPRPGRWLRLYNLKEDPRELKNLAAQLEYRPVIDNLETHLLARFLATHPESRDLPDGLTREEQIDWFLRPRDGKNSEPGILEIKYGRGRPSRK